MKRFSILLIALFVGFACNAQTLKFGHIDVQTLVDLMPERDSAFVTLQKHGAELEESLQEMQTEYQTKLNTYQQKQATWTAAVLETKQRELMEIQQRLEQFNQSAQQDFQELQRTVFAPVYQKANEAIAKVAKENGFTYIFTLGALVFFDPEQSIDVLPLAKAALGIPAAKVAPSQIPAPGTEAN